MCSRIRLQFVCQYNKERAIVYTQRDGASVAHLLRLCVFYCIQNTWIGLNGIVRLAHKHNQLQIITTVGHNEIIYTRIVSKGKKGRPYSVARAAIYWKDEVSGWKNSALYIEYICC